MRREALQRPDKITLIVRGKANFGARFQDAGELIQHRDLNEAAFVVTCLGPGIGKEDEYAPEAGIGKRLDDVASVFHVKPNVGGRAQRAGGAGDLGKEFGDARDIRFRSDHADITMRFRLPDQMFATAETDFQPGMVDSSLKI